MNIAFSTDEIHFSLVRGRVLSLKLGVQEIELF